MNIRPYRFGRQLQLVPFRIVDRVLSFCPHDRCVRRSRVNAGEPCRRVTSGELQPMGIDVARKIGRSEIEGLRDIAQGDAATRTEYRCVAHGNGFDTRLQHRRADFCHSLRQFLAGTRRGAARPNDAARAPGTARVG